MGAKGDEAPAGRRSRMESAGYLVQTASAERFFTVRNEHEPFTLRDNGGRRSGIERRRFSYFAHIPERRSGIDRRCGEDRRRYWKRAEGDDEQQWNM